jgi:hypothetical protein
LRRPLTIVGAGRESLLWARRERWEKLCARVALDAPAAGRSTSPLGDRVSAANRLLLVIAATFAGAGVLEPHFPRPGEPFNEISLAQSIAFAVLLFAWCKADAASRSIRPPRGAPILVALVAPIGVPYYFFRTRPGRTALRDIGKAVIFFGILCALYYGCYYLSARVT